MTQHLRDLGCHGTGGSPGCAMCVDVPEMQRRNRIARGGEARQDGYLLVVRMTGTVVGTNIIVIKSTDTLAPPCPLATARPAFAGGVHRRLLVQHQHPVRQVFGIILNRDLPRFPSPIVVHHLFSALCIHD